MGDLSSYLFCYILVGYAWLAVLALFSPLLSMYVEATMQQGWGYVLAR